MKLITYRITFLLSQIALFAYGVYTAIMVLIGMANRGEDVANDVYVVSFLGLCVGLVFVGCEIGFIARSFKKGTLLIDQICFHHDDKKNNKITLIIASILLTIGLFLIIYFGLCAVGVNPFYPKELIFEDFLFNIFLGLMIGIDAFYILLYMYLFYDQSLFIKIN